MKNFGLVSVITPSCNSALYISKTIDSILAQTYTNWELLITDDYSTDESCEVIQQYADKDKRIKLFRLEKNSGTGIARNNSIKAAGGRFIAFCDSDDCWLPQKLEKQLDFMDKKQCILSFSSYLVCDEYDAISGIVICKQKENLKSMIRDNGIGCPTAIYDSSTIGKRYLPEIRKRQDWAFFLDLLKECKVAYGMKEPLAIYRIRSSSISRKKKDLIKYNLTVYRTVLNYSPVKAYFTFCFLFIPCYLLKRIRSFYFSWILEFGNVSHR
jgi:glycosyltransferase involved in cell wall biosynthesis